MAATLVFLFCGPLALAFFFNGVIFVANAAFNNLGHPFYSTGSNWGRHTLGTIPFVMVGRCWFGAPGVLIGQYLGGAVFAVFALFWPGGSWRSQSDEADNEPFAAASPPIQPAASPPLGVRSTSAVSAAVKRLMRADRAVRRGHSKIGVSQPCCRVKEMRDAVLRRCTRR